jgi:hypothetical protein
MLVTILAGGFNVEEDSFSLHTAQYYWVEGDS